MVTFYIVDDEDVIREGLQFYFPWSQYGADAIGSAVNGIAALPEILAQNPDVVLTDVVMPKMDGLELARSLRKQGYTGEIIFLSAYQEMDYVKAAFKCAATDFLFKPIQTAEMDTAIREVVARVEKKSCSQKDADTVARIRRNALWAAFLRKGSGEFPAKVADNTKFFLLLADAPQLDMKQRHTLLLQWSMKLPKDFTLLDCLPEGNRTDCLILAIRTDTQNQTAITALTSNLQNCLLEKDPNSVVLSGGTTDDPQLLPELYRSAISLLMINWIGPIFPEASLPLQNCPSANILGRGGGSRKNCRLPTYLRNNRSVNWFFTPIFPRNICQWAI